MPKGTLGMQVCRAGNITCLKHAAAAAVRRIML